MRFQFGHVQLRAELPNADFGFVPRGWIIGAGLSCDGCCLIRDFYKLAMIDIAFP
jgi:hypothetical protein